MKILMIVVWLVVVSVLAISCAAPAQIAPSATPPLLSTQPVSQPPVSSSPPISNTEWAADGNIGAQEYAATKKYGDWEVFWNADAQYIYLGIRAKTNGWVAFGIQPGTTMKNADIIFGMVKNGTASVFDIFSIGDFGPHPQDTELGGKNDILISGGREEGGFTTIEFKRALNTGDKYDLPLNKGINKIIWAYGLDDVFNLQHANRGYGELEIN